MTPYARETIATSVRALRVDPRFGPLTIPRSIPEDVMSAGWGDYGWYALYRPLYMAELRGAID